MCYHHQQTKDAQTLKNRFKAEFQNEAEYKPALYNGFDHPKTPIVRTLGLIEMFEWGFVSNNVTDRKAFRKKYNLLNARIETLHEKTSYKNYINNRCLILVDGFFEKKWLDEKGKKKEHYRIEMLNSKPFAFAGLFLNDTYTIVTTQADEFMAQIHNNGLRMPVILTEQNELDWLNVRIPVLDFAQPDVKLTAQLL